MLRLLAWIFDWELVWVIEEDVCDNERIKLLKVHKTPFGNRVVYKWDHIVHLNDDGTCTHAWYKKWTWARKKGDKLFKGVNNGLEVHKTAVR